jgi:hypothetical protein
MSNIYLGDSFNLNQNAFQYFCKKIHKNSLVLELGSGNSTKFLTENYIVHTIEHDEKWMNKYKKAIYHMVPISDKGFGYNQNKLLEETKDIVPYGIIIDGPPHKGRSGALCLKKQFKKCKVLLVDDTHRKEERKLIETIIEQYSFIISKTIKDSHKEAVILTKNIRFL